MKTKLLLSATILATSATMATAKTRLIVNCFWPAKHHVCTEILPNWIDAVETATDGRVTGLIPPKSVAPPPEQLAAVEKGLADVAIQFNGLIQNRVQGPLVAMQPFSGINDAEKMSVALWDTNREFFPDEFDTVELLSQFVISPGQLYSQTDTPINSIEDLSSRKMWVLPGPLAAIGKALGSGVVASPAAKSNEIISRGVVDGHIGLDAQAIRAFQLMPYTNSNTQFETPLYTTSFSVFANSDTWGEISAEDQAAIMGVSGSVLGAQFGSSWDAQNAAAEALYAEEGIDVIQADPAFEAALMEASKFVTTGWLKSATEAGIDAQAAMDFYQAQLAE